MKKLGVAVIGLGERGQLLLRTVLKHFNDITTVVAVSDLYEDRLQKGAAACEKYGEYQPLYADTNYKNFINKPEIDCVIVSSSWETHVPISIDAMNAGKYVGMEVGGAHNLDQCFELVKTYERTGMPCMMLENCCYGQDELMVLNMVKKGLFGEILHCEGGYHHDLRDQVALGHEQRHYRINHYMHRNGEVYPTHELGPIAKVLNINRGNRMVMLTAMASKSGAVNRWIKDNKGEDYENANYNFAMGDVITTCIKCAHGETIVLTHDTTIPRAYSRGGVVQGTKGTWSEDCGGILIDGMGKGESYNHKFIPMDDFREEHSHPLWKEYKKNGPVGGHGGMDGLCLAAFFDAALNKTDTPIDAYDTAAWMAITCLSEDSIAMGSMPVAIPDFTYGKWINRKPFVRSKYCLEDVCTECFEGKEE